MSEATSPSPPPPPAWHADPCQRHELRWWDGTRWTEHVSNGGSVGVDPLDASPPTSASPGARPVGSVLAEPVLVVNQKVKLVELTNQYAVYDQHGREVAAVTQIGQSAAKKVLRALTSIDQFLTHRLEITDTATGKPVLRLTRPAKILKSTVIVSDPEDREIGRIVQQNAIGKINFRLVADGQTYGAIKAENWRAWDFRIEDHTGIEVARITKTWEGLAKTLFTTADNYVVQIHRPLSEPLRSLVVASALSVDTALKQDNRGFS